ncbi:GntR family transcriptional regulator [Clostridium rectalis]|uniref:GntR family transcriptional regulator n=1 Tax=Clostridium rectalis TaxID=2040295 RepID=UPI000F63745A|nr:GntR family transcriptional regulator [Clostridium rectalis]
MGIDKDSPIPVYYQLKEKIKKKINNEVWKVGQCIDSERELSDHYQVSRMTVRQALGELVQEGILVREKGKGTFVCEPRVKQRDIMSFSEIAKRNGFEVKTKVLEFYKMKTPEYLSDILPFEYVYHIRRLRKIKDDNIAVETVNIPCDYCGYIDEDLLKGSLYKLLNEYGYIIDHSESYIQAILIDGEYKRMLDIKEDIPLLKIYSENFTEDGKVLFTEESVYRGDKYLLEVNIFRREGKIK